jgi:hypothetical protein
LLGDGAGGFAQLDRLVLALGPPPILLEDVDLDGHLDLVVLEWLYDQVLLFHGDGRARFGVRDFTRSFPATSLTAGDVDRDGDDDVVVCESWPLPSHLRVDFADGHGDIESSLGIPITFPSGQGQIAFLELADVDGDGWLDLIGTDYADDVVLVVHSTGAGSFGAYEFFPAGDGPYGLLVRDFDRDGVKDIFVANYNGQALSFLRGDGVGFLLPQTIPLGASPAAIATRDLNGDSAPDLVAACFNTHSCSIVLSDGMGGFQSPSSIATPVFPKDVALGDFDEDGAIDLALAAGGSGPVLPQVYVAFGDAAGSFGPLSPTGVVASQLLLADLDQDGNTDIAGTIIGALQIAFGDGSGSFGPTLTQRSFGGFAIASGDFDADGRPDLFLTGSQYGGLRSLLNQLGDDFPKVYCAAKTNSLGCTPQIEWTGTSSASASSDFTVSATRERNRKSGLLFYGVTSAASAPFQGGTLCVAAPIKRSPGVNAGGSPFPVEDCSGVFAIDMNAFASGAVGGTPLAALRTPGTRVWCQWWGRDPGFAPPFGTSLSDGLTYLVGP